ncbi:MAG: O-antigen ligase family protein [Chthoniobacteraceae bacterium]
MNQLHAILILAAIAVMQLLFGGGDGTRAIYTLPAYALLGISGVLAIYSFWKAPARLDRSCLVGVILLAIYGFVRIALSPSAWLAGFDFYALLAALLIYFVTALLLTGQGARCAVVCGLMVLGVGHVAVGIYQFAKDTHFHPLLSGGRGEAGFRASGFFISPNHLAGFLEAALLLATSLCLWGGFRARGKLLIGYLACVCLAGLVLTGSRGGYLSAAVGLVVFTCLSIWTLRARLSHRLLPRIVGLIAAITLLGGGLAFVADRSFAIRTRANTVFDSTDVRLQLWEAAWKQFKLAPVFGTGSRTYVYYGRMFRTPQVDKDPVFAHNDWLQTLAEYGIVGILLVVAFVAAHLRHGFQRWTRMVGRLSTATIDPGEKHALALQIGIISAIAASLAHAMMDFNLHIPANLLLTALLFGMLATRRKRTDEQKDSWPARSVHAIPAVLGLWMLIAAVPRIPGELSVEAARGEFEEGKIPRALEDAGKAIGRGARNPDLYFHIGEVQRILSHALRTEEERRAALEDAEEAYAEAVAIYPQDVGIVLRDAWALGRLGRFEEAEPLLVRAKELDPNSPRPWLFSALHWKLRGMPAEALEDYRKAVALGPGWIFHILAELHENFDPARMEQLLQDARAAEPK